MKVAIGGDHAGFELKGKIIDWLKEAKIEVVDLGNCEFDPKDDYPDFAIAVARYIADKKADKGIVVCGSGVGANIAANKVKGARACLCHDTYSAHQGVEHDDMNVLCLGGRIIGQELAREIVQAYVKASYIDEERFTRRLNKILELEK